MLAVSRVVLTLLPVVGAMGLFGKVVWLLTQLAMKSISLCNNRSRSGVTDVKRPLTRTGC